MDKSEVATVKSFSTLGEAEIYKGLLDSAGITSVIQHDILSGMIPIVSPMPDIKLVVAAKDEQQARKILNAKFDKKEFEREFETESRLNPVTDETDTDWETESGQESESGQEKSEVPPENGNKVPAGNGSENPGEEPDEAGGFGSYPD